MSCQVLVLNSGSSSIKFRLFDSQANGLELLHKGQIEGLGTDARFIAGAEPVDLPAATNHISALQFLLEWLQPRLDRDKPLVVGHRVVHGGTDFSLPVRVTPEVIKELKKLEPLAPLHQPHNLSAIEALSQLDSSLPQIACFDTAFHAGHGKPVDQFALPRALYDEGVRRYGFHGLSYEFIASALRSTEPELARGNVIVAHLGNGASMCALKQGRSIDSTMGFSALDGLAMGTRCGSIDAGIILYLLQEQNLNTQQLSDLLYKKSGLLGVSGISNDMRVLLDSPAASAREAIDLYVHRIVREAGGLTTMLEGLDGLVFTGGIGEHAAEIRQRVCERLGWLGIELDQQANAENSHVISSADSRIKVCVIPTNEELMIAQHTLETLAAEQTNPQSLAIGK